MPQAVAKKKTIRTIGDGDVQLFERQIGFVEFAENQTRKYDVKQQPNLIKRFLLHVEVSVTVGSIGPVTFNNPLDTPFDMIRNIQVRTSQGLILKNFSAIEITLLNNLEFFTNSLNTAPVQLENGPNIFEYDVIIPFEDHTGIYPERTILNTNQYNDLTLFIAWEDLSSIWGGSFDPQLDIVSVNCTIVSCERPPVDRGDELLARQQMIDTVANGVFNVGSLLLPENTMIKTLATYTYDGSGLRVNTEQENININYDSGNYVLRDLSTTEIQSLNKSYYHVEAIQPGVYVIEFDQMRDFKTLFRTKNRNYARATFTPIEGADGTIRLFRRRIATPKIITM